jgi:hypothetical protein
LRLVSDCGHTPWSWSKGREFRDIQPLRAIWAGMPEMPASVTSKDWARLNGADLNLESW